MVCYENCCCCVDRKTGARIISYLGLFFGFLGLLGNIWGFFTLKPKTHLELALIRFQISSEVRIRFGSEFADKIDSAVRLKIFLELLYLTVFENHRKKSHPTLRAKRATFTF